MFHNIYYARNGHAAVPCPSRAPIKRKTGPVSRPPEDLRSIEALLTIMRALRDPVSGCPWDVDQTFATIAPYTIEEAYEVADAIARGDRDALREELGDLLIQVIFHAQMAAEEGAFSFADVVEAICRKLLRRHPHVFADAKAETPDEVRTLWEDIKHAERGGKAAGPTSALDDVPLALPALARAVKLQDRAARVGFDWPDKRHVVDKLNEEMLELSEEMSRGVDGDRVAEEMGDLLFVYANLARHLKINPEDALRAANQKFVRRFRRIEALLAAQGRRPEDSTLEEMDALWDRAKTEEKSGPVKPSHRSR